MKDKACSRSLEKFTRTLKDALQKLRTPSAADADSSAMFDSPTMNANNTTATLMPVSLPVTAVVSLVNTYCKCQWMVFVSDDWSYKVIINWSCCADCN